MEFLWMLAKPLVYLAIACAIIGTVGGFLLGVLGGIWADIKSGIKHKRNKSKSQTMEKEPVLEVRQKVSEPTRQHELMQQHEQQAKSLQQSHGITKSIDLDRESDR